MKNRLVRFIFFANYFVGLIAVALALETISQLQLPCNTPAFYILLFLATVIYYTKAYTTSGQQAIYNNPRGEWYCRNRSFIGKSQVVAIILLMIISIYLLATYINGLLHLPLYYWFLLLSIPVAGLFYYGIMPRSFFSLNLRNTGWLKPFVIGYVWAVVVGILPVSMLLAERKIDAVPYGLMFWLFIKNWMFCTVNAIMFDIKDYADDGNQQLKTFVVRIGLRRTIFSVLIPLLLIGALSVILFGLHRTFGLLPILFNLVPFAFLLLVAYSLHRRKAILYYLIIIDGLLLVKALCGMAGMWVLRYTVS